MLKTEKERVVTELAERLRSSDTLIVADYRGLTMKEIDEVRGEILRLGARFTVVKNTLTKRAAEEAGITVLDEFLEGPTAIAFVGDGDMVAVAKTLNETARKTKLLELKGGVLQGRLITAEQVRDLASLPPADVLRGQVVGAIVGPLNAIVGLFTAPLRDLVNVVDARIRQLGEAGKSAGTDAEPEAPVLPETPAEPEGSGVQESEVAAEAEQGASAESGPEPELSAEPEPEASAQPEPEPEPAPEPEETQNEEQEE